MRAVRKDHFLGQGHSPLVDQWDWQRAINVEQRNLDSLNAVVVSRILKVLVGAEKFALAMSPS